MSFMTGCYKHLLLVVFCKLMMHVLLYVGVQSYDQSPQTQRLAIEDCMHAGMRDGSQGMSRHI